MSRRRLRFWPFHLAWLLFCALLFRGLREVEDPSRRADRILSNEAGRTAMEVLRRRDAGRFRDYHVVHVAWARAGEGAPERRWVVLADRVPLTGLKDAVVVELAAEDGRLLRIRQPAVD
ncbi:MAG TPA: hypothetical protein VNA04_14500 [Thermoanaerobaculia bacterium]|nr:hypothetical protein [Thermoanaerobaculia bacterium]